MSLRTSLSATLSVFFLTVCTMLTKSFFSLVSMNINVISKPLHLPSAASSLAECAMPSSAARPWSLRAFRMAEKSSGEISWFLKS